VAPGSALAAAVLSLSLALAALAHRGEEPAAQSFVPPAPGTYRLPPIQAAPEGEVLDRWGQSRALSEFTRGRITLLGLIYTRCTDPDGCPRSTWAFHAVRSQLSSHRELKGRVRLVSLSFDPAHDSPEELRSYRERAGAAKPGADWHFLTTASTQARASILEGFGQDLRVAADSAALPGSEEFSHTLKVFLIDPIGRVREIYTSAFLSPQVIVNDILTLKRESHRRSRPLREPR